MIPAAFLLALAAPTVDGLPLGALGRQELPAKGCAGYLWSAGPSHALLAMVGADPAILRVALDGTPTDLPLTVRRDVAPLGFAKSADYANSGVTITLDMTVQVQPGLRDGARVSAATLTITRPGQDVIIAPVAGLIGCASS